MGLCCQKNLLQKVEVLKGKLDLQCFQNKCLDCLINRQSIIAITVGQFLGIFINTFNS